MNLRTGPNDGGQGASIGGRPSAWPHAAAAARFGLLLALAAIVVAALLIQLHLGVYTDPLWLMLLCDRLLDGQTAYVDFLENSPPFAILIYMPPVAAARLFGVAREPLLIAYVLALVGTSLAFSGWLLARAGRLIGVGRAGALAALAALVLLPNYEAFGQRDHIALVLALPWLTLMGLRAEGLQPPPFAALAAGLVAGAVFAIRPYYALSFVLTLALVGWRRSYRALFGFVEVDAAIASAALSVAVSAAFFPDYVTRMLPIVAGVYVPVQHPSSSMLIQATSVAWLSILAGVVVARDGLQRSPLGMVALAASTGAFLAYLAQGKGYPYHGYAAVALLLFTFAVATAGRLANPVVALFAAMSVALVWFGDIAPGRVDLRWPIGLLVVAGLVCALTFSRIAMRVGSPVIRTASVCAASAAVGMAGLAFHADWSTTPPFLDEVSRLAPRPKLATISPLGEFAHPLVSRVGGVWTQSVISLLITDEVAHALALPSLTPSNRDRLERYRNLDRNRFLADVARTPPDAVIVDESWGGLQGFEDAAVKAWLGQYRVDATQTPKDEGGRTRVLTLYIRAPATTSIGN